MKTKSARYGVSERTAVRNPQAQVKACWQTVAEACLLQHTQEQGTGLTRRLASRNRSRSPLRRLASPLRSQGPGLGQADQCRRTERDRAVLPAARGHGRSLTQRRLRASPTRRFSRQKALPGTVARSTEGLQGVRPAPRARSGWWLFAWCHQGARREGRSLWDVHVCPFVHVYSASLSPPTSVSTYLYSNLYRNLYLYPHPCRKICG